MRQASQTDALDGNLILGSHDGMTGFVVGPKARRSGAKKERCQEAKVQIPSPSPGDGVFSPARIDRN